MSLGDLHSKEIEQLRSDFDKERETLEQRHQADQERLQIEAEELKKSNTEL